MASTTFTSTALLIWQAMNDRGINARSYFEKAGLDPTKLGDSNARYPADRMVKLWTSVEHIDEHFGVDVGLRWNPTTFHALGFAWLASHTLKEAMGRLARYSKLVNSAFEVSFELGGSSYIFTMATSEDPKYVHPFAGDAGITAILKMCRMLCGEQFSPLEIHIMRSPSAGTRRIEELFDTSFSYNSDSSYWLVDKLDAEAITAGGNNELARINTQIAEQSLSRLIKSDVTSLVKQAITERLPSGSISEPQIAADLNMSARTLNRKLQEDGLGFLQLVAHIREDLAMYYIGESHLSLSEISYLLGFSEQASLSRAFKRWTDTSPSEYRSQLLETRV